MKKNKSQRGWDIHPLHPLCGPAKGPFFFRNFRVKKTATSKWWLPMVHWSLRFWLLIMSQNTSYMKKKMLRDMSKLVNHQETIDSKKKNKERQKIQTNKKRHLLINIYVLLLFKTSSTPCPQTPNPNHPSIHFGGTIKILLHFGRETRAWEKSFVKS